MVNELTVFECGPGALDENTQDQFLRMVPAIRRMAAIAFRKYDWAEREDLVAETVANALVAFARLVARGKSELAYATPLATYGLRQVIEGRRVGSSLNSNDVSSEYCRRRRGIQIVPLQKRDGATGTWRELVIEDRRATPCELAIARLDIAAWLRQLPRFKRRIAEYLALGERTQDAAQRFQISPGRLSQLRHELKRSWDEFQNEFRGHGRIRKTLEPLN